MRNVALLVVVVLVLIAGSFTAHAQQGPAGGPGPALREGATNEFSPEQFPEVKARVLKMLDERRERLGQERACVEKATNHEDLKKCQRKPPIGGPSPRGSGQQRPMDPGMMGGQQQ
jgi:hypothetical protein